MKKVLLAVLIIALAAALFMSVFAENERPSAPPSGSAPGEPPSGGGPGGGGPGGSSQKPESYTAVVEYSTDAETEGEKYESTGADENAVLISGGEVVLKSPEITRVSQDSTGGDSASFYGVGAAVLTTGGAAYIGGAEIATDSAGGAGAFAYGDGVIYIANSNITTAKDTSGGVHAAGGGTLYGYGLNVETNGGSSAAIRSDRGGGTMFIKGGKYISNGSGSPAVYCTADITVEDADLAATGSEAVCIEGRNSLYLYDCDLSGNMPDNEQNDCKWNVIVYQSMSGDSEVGEGVYQMTGGSLKTASGGLFYTTNTQSRFILKGVDMTGAADNDFFLKCTGNANKRGWGSSGKNGADCTFTAIGQEMPGDIIWDSISELKLYLTEKSALRGAFIKDETNAGDGGSGYANLYIDEGSTWTVTGDSGLTNLYLSGKIVDEDGKQVKIVNREAEVLRDGDGKYTVTVEKLTEGEAFTADAVSDKSEHEKDLPSQLAYLIEEPALGTEKAGEDETNAAETDTVTVGAAEEDKKGVDSRYAYIVLAVIIVGAAVWIAVAAARKNKSGK